MNRHGIRYMFEHRLLPEWFYKDKAQFIGLLLHNKEILYEIIDEMFEKEEIDNPYFKESFNVDVAKLTEEIMMLKIVFPEPEEEPLCYCSYLFFDKDLEKMEYFCIEKGNKEGKNYPFVCAWSPDGIHYNYGHCTFEEYGDFLKCASVFMEGRE